MAVRVVRLPLNQAFKSYLSGDKFDASLEQAFDLLDFWYTYLLRYPWLLEQITGSTDSKGITIDYFASHPAASISLTLLLGAAAAVSYIREYNKQSQAMQEQAGDFQSSQQRIKKRLRLRPAPVPLSPASSPGLSSSSLAEQKSPRLSASSISTASPSPPQSASSVSIASLSPPASPVPGESSRRESLNKRLELLLAGNPELKKKYKKVSVSADCNEAELELVDKPEEKTGPWAKFCKGCRWLKNKMASAIPESVYSLWVALNLSSFAYWLLWIGTIAITAAVGVAGVAGLGMAAYGAAFGIGLVYLAIKIYSARRHRQKKEMRGSETVVVERDPALNVEAAADVSLLLKQAIQADEKARLLVELKAAGVTVRPAIYPDDSYLRGDEQMQTLGQNKWKKSLLTGLTTTIGTYVSAQYSAWLMADFLKEAAGVALDAADVVFGLGIAFMVCSAAYGIYKAVQRYREVQKYKAAMESQKISLVAQVSNLENIYERRLQVIESLKADILLLVNNVDDLRWLKQQEHQMESAKVVASGPELQTKSSGDWKSKAKQYAAAAFVFLAGATTGIMIGRIATIVGTITFIPFAAAMLSNPVTLAILGLCFLVYGSVKLAQYHMNKQEAKAKKLYEQRQQRVTLLKGQNEVAGLQIQLLNAKKKELLKKKGVSKAAVLPLSKRKVAEAKAVDDINLRKSVTVGPVTAKRSLFACKEEHMRSQTLSPAFEADLRLARRSGSPTN